MDGVVKTIRSILNTAKNGFSETQLHRVYREIEGKDIPYKKFRFNTLHDFLHASNAFNLISTRGGLYIRARLSQNSKHIVKLVGAQKCARKKRMNMNFQQIWPRPFQQATTESADNRNRKINSIKPHGQNQNSSRNRQTHFKKKIRTTNRKNIEREFDGNREMKQNQQQTDKHIQPMLTLQNSQNLFDVAHFWLRKFFKQVKFLLENIAAHPIIYDENHVGCFNEMAKTSVWKEIAHDYKSLSLKSDSSDDENSQEKSPLKQALKLVDAELNAFVESLHRCSKNELDISDRLNYSEIYYARESSEQAEITDHGLIDFLQNVAFILECIVVNPALYGHNNQLHRIESIKFPIWNHICTVYYEKLQNNDFELSDEDTKFEIKHLQRTIERHLDRLAKPLTMTTWEP